MPDLPASLSAALADRYRIERELGRGGMATVYLARDLKHNRPVALKVLAPDLARVLGPDRFLREISIAARLNHPHIMKLLDSGEADSALFYVMPFVEGESLRHRLNSERQLPVAEALQITREVADALGYAHSLGVIHRDIKPENILLEAGHAVVADFGIARAIDQAGGERITGTGMALGTPHYMSPEQAAGNRDLDGRSDQYSLGCVLYEMLAGQPPHSGPTVRSIIARRLSEKAPSVRLERDAVPPILDRALARALAPVPADRYPTTLQFAEDLARSASAQSEPALAGESRLPEPKRLVSRAGAAALAIVVVVAVGWLITRAGRSPVSPAAEAGLAPGVAVMPFRAVGPDLEYWREGMMQLLSFNLDGVEGLRKIDPVTVLNALKGHDRVRSGLEDALTVGRQVGASYVVTGSVVQLNGGIRLGAEVHDVNTGRSGGSIQVDGHPDSVTAMVDQLTIALLGHGLLPGIGGSRPINLSRSTTTSLPALKAYLEGERKLRRAQFREAAEDYQRALGYDSTMALAMHRLIDAVGWGGGTDEMAQPWSGPLKAQLDRLPNREAMLIRANFQGPDGIEALERFTRRYPDDADGWLALGDKQVHFGSLALTPADASREPLERAIAVNPTIAESYGHLIELAFLRLDSAWAQRLIREYAANFGQEGQQQGCTHELSAALVWGNDVSRGRALAALDTISTAGLLECVQTPLAASPEVLDKLSEAYERALRSTSDPYTLIVLEWRLLQVLVPRGKIDVARRELSRIAESSGLPGSHRVAGARWDLVLHLSGFPDSTSARRAARFLAGEPADPVNSFWLGALAAHEGRRSGVREARRSLQSRATGLLAKGDSVAAGEAAGLASALETFEGLTRGDRSRIPEFERALRRLPPQGWTVEQPQLFLRYRVGKLLLEWGEYEQAERYFLSFRPYDYLYTSQAEYHLGQIYEALGQRERAVTHYQRFLTWWDYADPNLRPIWEDARQALIRLAGREGGG
jgi:serine/threonine-protein kinase